MKKIYLSLLMLIIFLITSCTTAEAPYIGENGNWYINGKDSGISAVGEDGTNGQDGKTPTIEINEDGYWVINGVVTEFKAEGQNGTNGQDGKTPTIEINKDGYWVINGVVTEFKAMGEDGKNSTIEINEDGYWVLDGQLTNIKAEGEDGKTPTIEINEDGYWVINGEVTEVKAEGEDGVGASTIEINEDGYWVINGEVTDVKAKGEDGKDSTIEINEEGFWVLDGEITNIKAEGEDGKTPTIEINDEGYWVINGVVTEFKAKGENGIDGNTPYIGENGNWWIGDKDTGVLVNPASDLRGEPSDGLSFVIQTINGKAGMIVTEYTGDDSDVIIPNNVGFVPVIGIMDSVFYDTNIKSVSLSSNTIYLGAEVFAYCDYLTSVDFNNAKIETIPESAFENDKSLKEIQLPNTVKTLENDAFHGCPLVSINYENINYFGNYSLNDALLPYVYLNKDIEYVGSAAFSNNFIYIENANIPETWASNIDSNNNLYVSINCNKTTDYIYSIDNNDLILYQYLGTSNSLDIPNQIDGYNVIELGQGFNGYTEELLDEILSDSTYIYSSSLYNRVQEVYVPNTVKRIECFALNNPNSFIYIPNSVEIMNFIPLAYSRVAFEDSKLPQIKAEYIDNSSDYDISTLDYQNYNLNVSRDSIVVDNSNLTYYSLDEDGYTLLANLNTTYETTIKSSYNDIKVHTIGFGAVFDIYGLLNRIIVEEGIEKIRTSAICSTRSNLTILLPRGIEIINVNAIIVPNDSQIYVNEASKPYDWDSNWTDVNNIYYFDDEYTGVINGYLYYATETEVLLVKYIGNENVYIPREIYNLPVTIIKEGFIETNSSYHPIYKIYIPNSITSIEYHAFNTYASGTYIEYYLEESSVPTTWDTNWYNNPYYSGENTSYLRLNYNYNYIYLDNLKISGDFAYVENNDEITLVLYLGNITNNTNIYIPRYINGKIITTINTGFINSNYYCNVYIPKEIDTIKENAFVMIGSSTSYWNFYFERSKDELINVDENYFYNSYRDSSSYKYEYYDRALDY